MKASRYYLHCLITLFKLASIGQHSKFSTWKHRFHRTGIHYYSSFARNSQMQTSWNEINVTLTRETVRELCQILQLCTAAAEKFNTHKLVIWMCTIHSTVNCRLRILSRISILQRETAERLNFLEKQLALSLWSIERTHHGHLTVFVDSSLEIAPTKYVERLSWESPLVVQPAGTALANMSLKPSRQKAAVNWVKNC